MHFNEWNGEDNQIAYLLEKKKKNSKKVKDKKCIW